MTILASRLFAIIMLARTPGDRVSAGTVVDDQGKPVAGAQVVVYSPLGVPGNGTPVELRGRTDGEGRFVLNTSALGRTRMAGLHVWAYQPGLAIAAVPDYGDRVHTLALQKYDRRIVKVEGPSGQPIAGARISPRAIFTAVGNHTANVPDTLAESLSVITGADGTAPIVYLRGRDHLVAARMTTEAIGTQDVLIVDRPRQSTAEATIVIRLKKTSRIVGKVVDNDGRGIADQVVEVWPKSVAIYSGTTPLGFKSRPVRTGADGSFQTPETLMAGSTYRVAVRGIDGEPIFSDWITMTEEPKTLAPLDVRVPRVIVGRVVDRQGKPVADAEVFRSGDGSKRTSAKTDAKGRFSLGGFQQGPVFVFARGAEFRFHGQMIKPDESDITVELTRTTEKPARAMKKLADPISLEESRALARRLLDPWWQAAAERGDDNTRYWVLQFMAPTDPVGVLQKLETAKVGSMKLGSSIQSLAARALAETDIDEAVTVAESIADTGTRAGTLARLADELPGTQRDRKLALLDRAAVHARATSDPSDHVRLLGEVAVRLHELGELDKASALFADGVRLAHQDKDQSFWSNSFAGRLARVDLPEALALAKPRNGERVYGRMVASIAFSLEWDKHADAQRFLDQCPAEKAREWLMPVVTWKVATLDPARARQLVEGLGGEGSLVEHELCLALGAKGRDEPASRQAIAVVLRELDRLLQSQPGRSASLAGRLLPLAEAIDPALVPELFWRMLAGSQVPNFARFIAWYDRDVAAAIFEPTRRRLAIADDKEFADSELLLEAWSLFDPRAAVTRLEQMRMRSLDPNDNRARIDVIQTLSLDHNERWRTTWSWWEPIFNPSIRDVLRDRF